MPQLPRVPYSLRGERPSRAFDNPLQKLRKIKKSEKP